MKICAAALEDCAAASENISMFFKERATASESFVQLLLKYIFCL